MTATLAGLRTTWTLYFIVHNRISKHINNAICVSASTTVCFSNCCSTILAGAENESICIIWWGDPLFECYARTKPVQLTLWLLSMHKNAAAFNSMQRQKTSLFKHVLCSDSTRNDCSLILEICSLKKKITPFPTWSMTCKFCHLYIFVLLVKKVKKLNQDHFLTMYRDWKVWEPLT